MADIVAPPPPPKKSGPGRWILLGCGILTGIMILGMGGCFGIFYAIYRGTEPVAMIGADYLLRSPEIQQAFGPAPEVKRNAMGWSVNTANDAGNARITYTVKGGNRVGEAVVWLVKSGGSWSVRGARVTGDPGKTLEIGKPPKEHHRIDWDD